MGAKVIIYSQKQGLRPNYLGIFTNEAPEGRALIQKEEETAKLVALRFPLHLQSFISNFAPLPSRGGVGVGSVPFTIYLAVMLLMTDVVPLCVDPR